MAPPIDWDEWRKRRELVESLLREGYAPLNVIGGKGSAVEEAGARLGSNRGSVYKWVRTQEERKRRGKRHECPNWDIWDRSLEAGAHLSSGAKAAIEATGLSGKEAALGWRKVKRDDGSFDTVMWKAPKWQVEDDTLARIRAAFEGMEAAPPVQAPEHVMADLCNVLPLFDVHMGMHAWAKETGGEDYDLGIARGQLMEAVRRVTAMAPNAETCILLVGGDFFHQDDNRAETPQSRHRLDTDGRHYKVLEEGVKLLHHVVSWLLGKHKSVLIRVLRGNHDEHSHLVLTFALAERYGPHERVTVEKNPRDLFTYQWGRTLIAAHHGDKMKPEQMVLLLADVVPFWSATRYRYAYTGHVHHTQAKDIGGVRWESLRAFAPQDAYAASMGYTSRRALECMTFHRETGLAVRVSDPVERAA